MSDFTNFIEVTLESSSEIARSFFGYVTPQGKGEDNNQVLTEADLKVSTHMFELIRNKYPSHNVIDEEAKVVDNSSEFTWVLDPIDGTSNFASGSPLYGLKMGLLQNGEVIAGGVALPYFKEVYIGEKGSGAFCRGKRVKVTDESDLKKLLISFGLDGNAKNPQEGAEFVQKIAKVADSCLNVRSSNSAFDEMMVVRGTYGAYFAKTSEIWDQVATYLLVHEAGGVVTNLDGTPVDFSDPLKKVGLNYTCLMGSKSVHSQLLNLLKF